MIGDEAVLRWLVGVIVLLAIGAVAFAATAIALHWRRKRSDEQLARLEATWTGALHDVLAEQAIPEALWTQVNASDREHFVTHLVEYAAILRGEELQLVRLLAQPMLPAIASELPQVSAPKRAMHIRALAALGMPQYAPQVLAALKDPSQLVAATAMHALCRSEHAAHATAVIASLSRFDAWSTRLLGILLSRFGEDAAEPLRTLLGQPAAPVTLRVAAAHALWSIRDVAAVNVAATLLGSSPDESLAVACLRIIEGLGGSRHADLVRSQLNHPSGNVRGRAVAALAAIGEPQDAGALRAALNDPSPWVALRAANGLARTDRPSLRMAAVEDDDRSRLMAREALSE